MEHNQPENYRPISLTIAGSDSGAGAGIQADLKTFAAHGVFAATVVTLVTAQNTIGVTGLEMVSAKLIEQQLEAVFSDFNVASLKTGALGNVETIKVVAAYLSKVKVKNLVVDPVMVSKHGHHLMAEDAVPLLTKHLLPLATVVTPNLPEAAKLAGMKFVDTRDGMLEAARRIAGFGCQYVVVKGGHSGGDPADLVYGGADAKAHWLEARRVDSPHTHGTGCTFSAAIAANLALGMDVVEATRLAKQYISGVIEHSEVFGKGINPVNHFWKRNAR